VQALINDSNSLTPQFGDVTGAIDVTTAVSVQAAIVNYGGSDTTADSRTASSRSSPTGGSSSAHRHVQQS